MPRTVFTLEGFVVGYARVTMNNSYITHHKDRATIEHRIKVLKFFSRYGPETTKEAFGTGRSTVYLWQQKLRDSIGRLESLAPGSRAPKTRRRRLTPPAISDYIVAQRHSHPGLGKDKLASLLKPYCRAQALDCPSASSVGRILNDLKDQDRLPKAQRLRLHGGKLHQYHYHTRLKKARRGSFQPQAAGELVQIDCVVKFIHGLKRYVISAIDCHSEFAFSMAYASLSSAKAKDFLLKFNQVAPFELTRVQTDNGSEFYKLFHQACESLNISHLWNYPRSPKMNTKIERYNRSIQEEFADWHLEDLAYALNSFNAQLMDWLIWYNTERPHWSLKLKSPMQYMLEHLQLSLVESNMLWTDTCACN